MRGKVQEKKISECTAFISNIQRFSTHDGPGIRTIAFFKGCPLKCPWCSNPESQTASQMIMQTKQSCMQCLKCIQVCDRNALREKDGLILVDYQKCDVCGKCVEICPTSNIQLVGREYSVDELADELIRDKVFYDRSNGGVTYSGGEPTLHTRFLVLLSKKLKSQGINIAVETCGYFDFDMFKELLPYLDLILFDLKVINEEAHRRITGKSNRAIIVNLKRLVNCQKEVIIRFPVIPGYTDSAKNINAVIHVMKNLGLNRIDILPYHRFSESKYERLGLMYELKGLRPSVINKKIQSVRERFHKASLLVSVGG
jgi:pyruvate formate lyase activating enzyme